MWRDGRDDYCDHPQSCQEYHVGQPFALVFGGAQSGFNRAVLICVRNRGMQ
jgi:hypothetical protein